MPRQYLMPDTATAVTDAPTLPALLACRIARSPEGKAYRPVDPASQHRQSLTWSQAGDQVARWRDALAAILLPNGLDAMSIYQAALALGMVPVPMHAIDNPGSIAYTLNDCVARRGVEPGALDRQNVMLSPALKLKRLNPMAHFGAKLQAMYVPH